MKTYKFRINGNEYNVDINSVEGNIADIMDWCPEYKPAHGKMARWKQEQ